jgi:hypothetical protein
MIRLAESQFCLSEAELPAERRFKYTRQIEPIFGIRHNLHSRFFPRVLSEVRSCRSFRTIRKRRRFHRPFDESCVDMVWEQSGMATSGAGYSSADANSR